MTRPITRARILRIVAVDTRLMCAQAEMFCALRDGKRELSAYGELVALEDIERRVRELRERMKARLRADIDAANMVLFPQQP